MDKFWNVKVKSLAVIAALVLFVSAICSFFVVYLQQESQVSIVKFAIFLIIYKTCNLGFTQCTWFSLGLGKLRHQWFYFVTFQYMSSNL
jgi:hypothetical protein